MEAATLAFARDLSSDTAEDLLDAVLGRDAGSLASFVTESPGTANLLLTALAKACASADEEIVAPALEITEAMASGNIASLRWLASSHALMASILSVIDRHSRPESILASAAECCEEPDDCCAILSQGLKTAAVICSVKDGRLALLSTGSANDDSTAIILRAATSIANVVASVCCSKETLKGLCRGSKTSPSMRRRRTWARCFDDGDSGRGKMQRVGNKDSSRAAEPLLSPERLSNMPREVATGLMEDALGILAQPLLLAGIARAVPLGELPVEAATDAYGTLHHLWHSTHPRAPSNHSAKDDDTTTRESGRRGHCDDVSSEILTGSGRRALATCVARLAAERRFAEWAADDAHSPPVSNADRQTSSAGAGENLDGSHIPRWLLQGSVATSTAGDNDHGVGDASRSESMRHQMTPEVFFQRKWEKMPVHIRAGSNVETDGSKFDRLGFRDISSSSSSSSSEDAMIEALCHGGYSCPQMNSTDTDALQVLYRQAAERSLASPVAMGVDLVAIKEGQNLSHGQGQQEVAAEEGQPGQQQSAGMELDAATKAYREGFTLARQGLTRLSPGVFEAVTGLSSAMGLSSGANAYLTPAGSQGLAPHYDDHCVFVLQIAGSKTWRVCDPRPEHTLPRLRRPRLKVEAITNEDPGYKEFALSAGDCLYIPRGFPHVAQTDGGNASFHLSLGLEVEPFMEWSAALHVALRIQAREPAVGADAISSQAAARVIESTEETACNSILASAEELLHLVIEEAASAGAVPELRAACPSVACSVVEAWMTTPGPEGKGEDPATAAFCRLGQRVFGGPGRCQFEHALRLFERQQQQQQPSQAGPLPQWADGCKGDDESHACWRHWLPLAHKGETSRAEEEDEDEDEKGGGMSLESDICNCRDGLQRAFVGLRKQLVSVFTNDPGGCCSELWASVKSTMRSTAAKCLKTRELVQAAHLALSQKSFNWN